MKNYIKFKHDVEPYDIFKLKPKAFKILGVVNEYFSKINKDLLITSIYRPQGSSTHGDFRAVDFRTKHLTEDEKNNLVNYVNVRCLHIGAISLSDNMRRPIIVSDHGTAPHGHIQCERD